MNFFSANKIAIIALFVATVILAGCIGGPQESAENETADEVIPVEESKIFEVSIRDNSYSTTSLNVNAGNSVKWTNLDDRVHQVQVLNVMSSPVLLKGGTWTYTFYERGTYTFRDAELPYMIGTIVVK